MYAERNKGNGAELTVCDIIQLGHGSWYVDIQSNLEHNDDVTKKNPQLNHKKSRKKTTLEQIPTPHPKETV